MQDSVHVCVCILPGPWWSCEREGLPSSEDKPPQPPPTLAPSPSPTAPQPAHTCAHTHVVTIVL